jgi:hypothetical protein
LTGKHSITYTKLKHTQLINNLGSPLMPEEEATFQIMGGGIEDVS